jgi:hypothetical protein
VLKELIKTVTKSYAGEKLALTRLSRHLFTQEHNNPYSGTQYSLTQEHNIQ